MGFSTVDQVTNAISVLQKMQRLRIDKLMASVAVANVPHSLWKANGTPGPGTDPTVGAANGRTTTSASAGGFVYTNAASPATMHLISLGLGSKTASTTGTIIVLDRTSDIQLTHVQATTALTGLDGTSRMAATTAPGDGGMLWAEVTSALSATANTKNFTYTNQLGTGSQVTPNWITVASSIVGRAPSVGSLYVPLQTGDTGVRSVENQNHVSGTGTGQINYCIVRPIGHIPLTTVAQYVERDYVVEIPNLPLIYDSSCLFFIIVPTAAVTGSIFGELHICEN